MTSKFSGLLQAKQAQSPTVENKLQDDQAPVIENKAPDQSALTSQPATIPPVAAKVSLPIEIEGIEPAVASAVAKTDRETAKDKLINVQPQKGKKGHPDYNQVTIYLKRETQNHAKIALLQDRDDRDFSELVEDLLTGWLGARK